MLVIFKRIKQFCPLTTTTKILHPESVIEKIVNKFMGFKHAVAITHTHKQAHPEIVSHP